MGMMDIFWTWTNIGKMSKRTLKTISKHKYWTKNGQKSDVDKIWTKVGQVILTMSPNTSWTRLRQTKIGHLFIKSLSNRKQHWTRKYTLDKT